MSWGSHGLRPRAGSPAHLGADQTSPLRIRAQGEATDRIEVKTGVFYTGKKPAGGRKHRRWRLVDKGCYATTAAADDFGKGLAAQGFSDVGLHHARHVLCLHDGLDEFGQTFRNWFPHAIHQVDHFHIAERLWWVAGGDPRRHLRLKQALFKDPHGFVAKVRRATSVSTMTRRLHICSVATACRVICGAGACTSSAPEWSKSTKTSWSEGA